MRYIGIFIVAGLLAMPSHTTVAQLHVGISFNLDSQPSWGPTGYDYVEYYYMPDIEVYYDVSHRLYYGYAGGHWVGTSQLPSRYGHYDHYRSYKVVVNEREPWRHHASHKRTYASYRDRHDQTAIRDSRDSKYFVNKNHPNHGKWVKEQARDHRSKSYGPGTGGGNNDRSGSGNSRGSAGKTPGGKGNSKGRNK